ncbi:MAG: GntR family transcriptional regulator [Candidatus Leucobacter sulfamidivorax]|nr:GntR family transcriptional regulator [Candidatus Leucobacter sulfamidivorax]
MSGAQRGDGSVSLLIEADLRRAILEGELAPGEAVRQEVWAKKFNVSRLPVRQALQRLEDEGLMTITPYAGARVAVVALEDCIALYEMREAIEPLVVARSTSELTPEDLDEIREAMEAAEAVSHDSAAWLGADREFHRQVNRHCSIPQALKLATQLYNQTQQYRREYIRSVTAARIKLAELEHRTIFAALECGDAFEASERTRLHIRHTRLVLQSELSTSEDDVENPGLSFGGPSERLKRNRKK